MRKYWQCHHWKTAHQWRNDCNGRHKCSSSASKLLSRSLCDFNSVFNTVYNRSLRLVSSAINSDSIILHDVFYQSSKLAYCFTGYNCVFEWKHLKLYTEQDSICASFMRDVLAYPTLNSNSLHDDVVFACCA